MVMPYVSGAVSLWTGTADQSGTPELLGYGETAPQLEVFTKYGQIKCDLTGPDLPFDYTFAGCEALVSVTLTAWEETVARRLEIRPGPAARFPPPTPSGGFGGSGRVAGSWNQSDYGALIGVEGFAFQVWLAYGNGLPATLKPIYTTGAPGTISRGGMPAGYRIYQCIFAGPWTNEIGARPMKRQFMFRAWADGPEVVANATDPVYGLYDNNMNALSGKAFF